MFRGKLYPPPLTASILIINGEIFHGLKKYFVIGSDAIHGKYCCLELLIIRGMVFFSSTFTGL